MITVGFAPPAAEIPPWSWKPRSPGSLMRSELRDHGGSGVQGVAYQIRNAGPGQCLGSSADHRVDRPAL